MKKLLFISLLLCSTQIFAQNKPEIRLNTYANYVFDDRFDSYYSSTSYYNGKINASFQWGLGAEYMLNPSFGVELSYLRQDCKLNVNYFDSRAILNPEKNADFKAAGNYIFLGTTRYVRTGSAFEPYAGANLGMAIINVTNQSNNNKSNATKFGWGIKAGTNIWASKKVGIKLQATLNSITQGVGGGLYFGTGGISAGLSTYSSIYQFTLGGGLVFKLSNKK